MAYNLESLVTILEQILHPDSRQPWTLDLATRPQLQSLLDKACFLKELFENRSSSLVTSLELQSLESRTREATYSAEDVVESHLAGELVSRAKGERFVIRPPDLHQFLEEFDLIRDELVKIVHGSREKDPTSTSVPAVLSRELNPNNIFLGMEEDLEKLKDRVWGHTRATTVIPIVGPGGIGKTTLIKNLYDDPFIVSQFDVRAWAVVSHAYDVRKIIFDLLQCFPRRSMDENVQQKKEDLGLLLYQALYGRRYLIVLDDIWDFEAWDDVKLLLPNDDNGSRIVVTTRHVEVARYIDPHESLPHQMSFLNDAQSWDLLCRKVFGNESCPIQLEEFGKAIAKDCRGLPLAIHVIGGVLAKLDRSEESWLQVARDVRSTVTDKDEFSETLSLSYNHLPPHLKACFLYLSIYPEDQVIRVSKLVRLWVAEGFLKPISGKSLDETAISYLEELIDRNLLLVYRQKNRGIVKNCTMHDLLRELCIRKAHEEKFLSVVADGNPRSRLEDMKWLRRLSDHTRIHDKNPFFQYTNLAMSTRSFLYFGSPGIPTGAYSLWEYLLRLRVLRVLDILRVEFQELPPENTLSNLRYLAARANCFDIPHKISNMCNLQTVILHLSEERNLNGSEIQELFNLPQLRHIKFVGEYPLFALQDDESVDIQENLETLSSVAIDESFSKIVEATSNLKKLGIYQRMQSSWPSTIDLTSMDKLERLRCSGPLFFPDAKFPNFVYPHSLKKLHISSFPLSKEHLNEIDSLPNLESLKLQLINFDSMEWAPREGGFANLRVLILEDLYLTTWIADETHFPMLECLIIRDCGDLEEIPSGIGEICTLVTIELQGLSTGSMLESVKTMHDDQMDYGNTVLQVRINACVEGSRDGKTSFDTTGWWSI